MKLSRREFLLLSAGLAAGCSSPSRSGNPSATTERVVNAGSVKNYLADGVYANFSAQGFFLVRRGGNFFALAAICTHRACRLTAEHDRSFSCPCHGSTFDANGKVTQGPARRDLPGFPVTLENGELLVKISGA